MANLKGGDSKDAGNIKVCVRVRPFLPREENATKCCCIKMPNETRIEITEEDGKERNYTYDRAYWSHNKDHPLFADQVTLMNELGYMLIENALAGFNCCLFAYGQTGSGKTHSVLGYLDPPENKGLLPRIVEHIFKTIDEDKKKPNKSEFKCHVSYLEIYNETFYDLLIAPDQRTKKLDAHVHPQLGVHIPGLTESPVTSHAQVQDLIDFGSKTRTVAATCMNATSSRSHCIFVFEIEKKTVVNGKASCLRSRVNLVDLAGSERQKRTEAVGERLKEGSMINQSLSSLANVISKLAEAVNKPAGAKKDFIPFRNSKLTYILQDSLSGNSKTVMCAAISPSLRDAAETLTTLRFANNVKTIKTSASKNEQSKESILDDLKRQAAELRKQLAEGGASKSSKDDEADELAALDALTEKYGADFEDELAKAQEAAELRKKALESMGLGAADLAAHMGIEKGTPQLININEDASLSGCLAYFLMKDPQDAVHPVGTSIGSAPTCKIKLTGLGMTGKMITIFNEDNKSLTFILCEGRVMINGRPAVSGKNLKHNDRLVLGHAFIFRVNIPNDPTPTIDRSQFANVLEQVVAEALPPDTERYSQCLAYVKELAGRLHDIKAELVIREFLRYIHWVDEANTIAREFKSHAIYRYELEVMNDLYTYESAMPELVVRLYKLETAKVRLGKAIKEKYGKAKFRNLFDMLTTGNNSSCIAVYELHTFRLTLVHLREVFGVIQREGFSAIDMESPAQNPFMVLSPKEIARLLALEKEKAARTEANMKKRATIKMGEVTRADLRGLQITHGNEKSKFEETLKSIREKVEDDIDHMEHQIEVLQMQIGYHKAVIDTDGKLMNQLKPRGRVCQSVPVRLQRAGEELAWAMGLANDIFARTQAIQELQYSSFGEN